MQPRLFALIMGLLATHAPTDALAYVPMRGSDLIRWCASAEFNRLCDAYLQKAVDSAPKAKICLPEAVSQQSLRDAVARTHMTREQQSAEVVPFATKVLSEAFPCAARSAVTPPGA